MTDKSVPFEGDIMKGEDIVAAGVAGTFSVDTSGAMKSWQGTIDNVNTWHLGDAFRQGELTLRLRDGSSATIFLTYLGMGSRQVCEFRGSGPPPK